MACGKITQLRLEHYRNHNVIDLATDSSIVVLCGANGSGKTNILESISMLVPGRGLRNSASADIVNFSQNLPWSVNALVIGENGGASLKVFGDKHGKKMIRDGLPVKHSADLADVLQVTWLTPAMDTLLNGPGGDRRKFIDRFTNTIEPFHSDRVTKFEKYIKERKNLLQWGRFDKAWIDRIELKISELAVAITIARISAIQTLEKHLNDFSEIIDEPAPLLQVTFEGDFADSLKQRDSLSVENEFVASLAKNRENDLRKGSLTSGPTRDDLVVMDRRSGLRANLCSTGQRKSMLLLLVLAQASVTMLKTGVTAAPLLLDEVAAHLDAARRGALLNALVEFGCQVWLTGTEAELFADLSNKADFFSLGKKKQ